MILYCIRHGESAYNSEGRIQGQLDIPLSPLGRQQSEALAEAFREAPIEAIYASPLRRAMETAEPLAAALRLPIRTDDRLKEIHAGVFQGLLWSEIEAQYPEAAIRWKAHDFEFVIPGGESRRQLAERGAEALREIHAADQARAIVVSHGGLLSAALKRLLQIAPTLDPFRFYNAAISRIEWSSQLKLLTLNQLDHLRAAGLERETKTGDL